MELGRLPFLERLAPCRRILLAGMGGGFDVLAGLPLFHHLRGDGREPSLASLSFSDLGAAKGRRLASGAVEVLPDAAANPVYFPEMYLSAWFASQSAPVPIYCYSASGAMNLRRVFEDLVRELDIDALVLVDGGTDSLMRGDEPGLGTPAEDMTSLAAAHMLELPVKLMLNLGFGVDAFHGVCHAYVLEAVADLTRDGGFLGAFSLLPQMPEFRAFVDAARYVCWCMPGRESIVATSVAAAGDGWFGDHHTTTRTYGSRLFINPLMSMYWCFDLDAVARRCLYMDYLRDTWSHRDVHRAIHNYLATVASREWMNIPL